MGSSNSSSKPRRTQSGESINDRWTSTDDAQFSKLQQKKMTTENERMRGIYDMLPQEDALAPALYNVSLESAVNPFKVSVLKFNFLMGAVDHWGLKFEQVDVDFHFYLEVYLENNHLILGHNDGPKSESLVCKVPTKTIYIGDICLDHTQIYNIANSVTRRNYDPIKFNCQHAVNEVLNRLGFKPLEVNALIRYSPSAAEKAIKSSRKINVVVRKNL
jgi:hypothetical protein